MWDCYRLLERKTCKEARLELQMALDEPAKLFAILVAHVDELDAAAIRADIADDGGEIDFAQAGANFEFDRVADCELPRRFQIRAAQADRFYASETRRRAFDLRAQR